MTTPPGTNLLTNVRPCIVCHITTVHRQLKSRTFHRELLPLAEAGVEVRYLSPALQINRADVITFVPLKACRSRWWRILSSPGLLPVLLRQRADVYHFQDPELMPLAFLLKLICRKRVIYDCYEDFPSTFAHRHSIPIMWRSFAARATDAAEKLAARCFDGLVTADAATLRRFGRRGNSQKIVFYNFPNLDFFPESAGGPKSFDIVYRGGLSERAGTELLLDAMGILASEGKRPRLLLLGYFDNQAAEQRLLARVRDFGLENRVEIRGAIPHEQMAEALSSAAIGVCPLQPVPKFLANIPVKVFEYWACSMPVVASNLPPIQPFFRHGEAGLLFEPESARQLARALSWLLDHPAMAARMGRRGRELVVSRFNNQQEVRRLHRFCARIAGSHAA
jgi:glycosyltransferase involved in cell wall biosynthesis